MPLIVRSLCIVAAIFAAGSLSAGEIVSTGLQLPSSPVLALGEPFSQFGPDFWLKGTSATGQQYFRFLPSGELVAAGPALPPRHVEFAPGIVRNNGQSLLLRRELAASDGTVHGCSYASYEPASGLRWIQTADCGSEQSGGSWWTRSGSQTIGYWLSDGSVGQQRAFADLGSLAVNPSLRVLGTSLFDNSAVVEIAAAHSTYEIVELDRQLNVTWRFKPTLLAGEALDDLHSLIGLSGEHIIVGHIHSEGSAAGQIYLAELDAHGGKLFERRVAVVPGTHAILDVRRMRDGGLLVYFAASRPEYSSGNTTFFVDNVSSKTRSRMAYALLDPDGEVVQAMATERKLKHAQPWDITQRRDHSIMIFANDSDAFAPNQAVVWKVDGQSQPVALSIGEFTGVAQDVNRLLVFGTALGTSAMIFDGGANSERRAFFEPPPINETFEVLAAAGDGNGAHYVKLRGSDQAETLASVQESRAAWRLSPLSGPGEPADCGS